MFFIEKKYQCSGYRSLLLTVAWLIGELSYTNQNIQYINALIQMMIVLTVSFNFSIRFQTKCIVACSWTVLRIIIEFFVVLTLYLGFKVDFNLILTNGLLNIIASIFCQLIMLIFINWFRIFLSNSKQVNNVFTESSIQICIMPFFSIVILVSYAQITVEKTLSAHLIIFSLVLLVFSNIFYFYLCDKIRTNEKLQYENVLLKNQTEYFELFENNINDSFELLNALKHDTKYHLLYIQSKLEENSEESLLEIKANLKNLLDKNITSTLVEYTGNKKLNRLVNYKFASFSNSDILIDSKINVPENAHIDELSLYLILGNAIDNAIRNFDTSQSVENCIKVRIWDDDGNLYIKISNPFDKKIEFKNGLPITDKKDKTQHGYGLKSIRKIVDEKKGLLKISCNSNNFIIEILLYDELIYKKHEEK